MRSFLFFAIGFCLLACQTQTPQTPQTPWTHLLDQDMSQWDTYLSFKHQIGYDGSAPVDEAGKLIEPIGFNIDPLGVFQMIEEEGEAVLKISGEAYGCVISKKEYDNYHLKLKVKWGDIKWDPRKEKLKDSGVLYHSIGPNGVEHWRSWMLSQEFQVMEGHMGDFWSQATSMIDIKAYTTEAIMSPVADASQPFLSFGDEEKNDVYCMRSHNMEKIGEWNELELVCFEGKSLHIVNGEVVMILQNSRYLKDGQEIPLQKGKIQIQSEAAEVFYKEIKIQPITSLPPEYESLFK